MVRTNVMLTGPQKYGLPTAPQTWWRLSVYTHLLNTCETLGDSKGFSRETGNLMDVNSNPIMFAIPFVGFGLLSWFSIGG